jgi:predicted alpha/beta hydrolase family esterase
MKRVFIVHGWGDRPADHWIPWLKRQLERDGLSVVAPAMPGTEAPVIGPWVAHLNGAVGEVDADTYYVGHSIGCQTVLRHLEHLPPLATARGAVFAGPWFHLSNMSADEMLIAQHWIDTPIDYGKVRTHLPELDTFFSTDDEWVPLDNRELFEQRLGARTHVLEGRKHMGVESGMKTFPELLAVVRTAFA